MKHKFFSLTKSVLIASALLIPLVSSAVNYSFSVTRNSTAATSAGDYMRGVALNHNCDYVIGVNQVKAVEGTASTYRVIKISDGTFVQFSPPAGTLLGGVYGGSDFAIASDDKGVVVHPKHYSATYYCPWRWLYKAKFTSGSSVVSAGANWELTNSGPYTTTSWDIRSQAFRINGDITGTSSVWSCPAKKNFVIEFKGSSGAFSSAVKYTVSGLPSGYTHGDCATGYKYDDNKFLICSPNGVFNCNINGTSMSATNVTPSGVNKINLVGSAIFKLRDHIFFVRSTSNTSGASNFGIFDVTNGFPGTSIYADTPRSGTGATTGTNMWINFHKQNDNTMIIVVFVRGLCVAKYTMTAEVLANPTFSPASGTTFNYGSNNVTITGPSGSTIYYKQNGTQKSGASPVTVAVSSNTSLTEVYAQKDNYWNSGKVSASYSVRSANVTYNPSSAQTYNNSTNVTLTSASGGTIYYTLDGTTPTTSSSSVSSGGTVTLDDGASSAGTRQIKAFAVSSGYAAGNATTSPTYTFKCATPTANKDGGSYTSWQFITFSCTTTGATIRYTTDGSEPTASSTAYSGTITLKSTTRLRAKAFKSNYSESNEFDQTYTINATLAAPTFSPATGEQFTTSGSVTITALSGSTLHYSTDGGSTYTTASGNTATVTITQATTLKAYATQTDKTDSSVAEASYTVKCPAPSISPATGTYAKAQSVTISCADAGATIYYTTDGSTPTTSSTAYSGTFTVSSTSTVKAIAVRNNCVNSDVASETITITPQSQPVAPSSINVAYSPVIGTSTNNPDRDLARIDATITFDRPNTSDGTTFPAYPTTFSDYYLDHYIVTVFSGSGYAKTEDGANFLSVSIDAKSGAGAANTVSLKACDLKVGQQTEVYVTAHYVYQPTSAASQSSQTTKSFSGYTYTTYSPSISAKLFLFQNQEYKVWWESEHTSVTRYADVYRVEIQINDAMSTSAIPVSYYQLQMRRSPSAEWENIVDRTINNLCYGDSIEAHTTYPTGFGLAAGRFPGNYNFGSHQYTADIGTEEEWDINLEYYYAFDVTPPAQSAPRQPLGHIRNYEGNEDPTKWQFRIVAVYGGSDSVTVDGTPVTPTTDNVSESTEDVFIQHANPIITGVDSVKGDVNIKEVQYYDLRGVRLIEAPSTGFYIEVRLYDNGQIATSKRLAR